MTPEERQEIRERPFHIELDGPFEDGSWAVDINLDEVGHRGLTAGSSIIDAIRNAIESWPDELGSARLLADYDHLVEERARARHWVEQNRDVWSHDPTDQFAMATADLFQKVLNVMDTGNPLRALIDTTTPETCYRYWGSDGTLCAKHHRRFANDSAMTCDPATPEPDPDDNPVGLPRCHRCGDVTYRPDPVSGRQQARRCAGCHRLTTNCTCPATPEPVRFATRDLTLGPWTRGWKSIADGDPPHYLGNDPQHPNELRIEWADERHTTVTAVQDWDGCRATPEPVEGEKP